MRVSLSTTVNGKLPFSAHALSLGRALRRMVHRLTSSYLSLPAFRNGHAEASAGARRNLQPKMGKSGPSLGDWDMVCVLDDLG